ncbi:MAG: sirohydrochlorin cobaltochelatase [Tissierellia bacterium]|nr:sirohydrochlorin cobaltochelatase [Tissierellia bacterium]
MDKGIIIASFGTSVEETRRKSISRIENAIHEAFPEAYSLRAFTSRMIRNRLIKEEGLHVFTEKEAYDHLLDRGLKEENIFIQPLHVIPGYEYEKLVKLDRGRVGLPLFSSKKDLDDFVGRMDFDLGEGEALILFGHGTDHTNDVIYRDLQEAFRRAGHDNIFVVCVEGNRPFAHVEEDLAGLGLKRVHVQPLMIVAGVHALEDMDSQEEGSLRRTLEERGYEVVSRMKGLGEYPEIVDMFVQKTRLLLEGSPLEDKDTYIGRQA